MALINVGDLFMDTLYADIIFVVDKKEIPGHRLVLAKTCDYFDKLLFGDYSESKPKKVEISGTSVKVFTEVLRFIYKEQLKVEEWTIKDLLSLLAVAHEFKLKTLYSAVIEAVKEKPIDFDSWPLVSSAASVYNSEELRRKCASFAEEKIEDFILGKDLEKFSAELICSMLECPSMSSSTQDHVVKAICNWKQGHSSTEVTSVMQKICWNKVSPDITAVILQELFSTVTNIEEHRFWTNLSADIEGQTKGNALEDCISRVDRIVLKTAIAMKFTLPENKGNFCYCLYPDCLAFCFQRDARLVEITLKGIEFEASTKFNIEGFIANSLNSSPTSMIFSEPTSNFGCFKYSAVFSDAKPVVGMYIRSQEFENMHEISLRNVIIY